jgi:hypothetical protein
MTKPADMRKTSGTEERRRLGKDRVSKIPRIAVYDFGGVVKDTCRDIVKERPA